MQIKRVFITGGASGLGFALAQEAAAKGWKVCIGDRDTERGEAVLESLQRLQSDAFFMPCDVTRISDLEAVAKELQSRWGGVDIVVNNAGVAQVGPITETSISDWQWIIDINLLGVVRGCKVFTPIMQEQGQGYFLNVASLAGLLDMPNASSYNATKAAVVSLSETLHNELKPNNIGVTVLCPSFFKTNLAQGMRSSVPDMDKKVDKWMASSKLNAADVAKMAWQAVDAGKLHALPHREGRTAWYMKRFLPRSLYQAIVHKKAQSRTK